MKYRTLSPAFRYPAGWQRFFLARFLCILPGTFECMLYHLFWSESEGDIIKRSERQPSALKSQGIGARSCYFGGESRIMMRTVRLLYTNLMGELQRVAQ